MKRAVMVGMVVVAGAFWASMVAGLASAADAPADRVVVMYFHRTQRCPTCLRMGSYTEEAVKSGFAQELKQGKVALHFIDFQDPKNALLTRGYGVAGPSLIVVKVNGKKVAAHKNLKEMWAKSPDKTQFVEYVQGNVKEYLK